MRRLRNDIVVPACSPRVEEVIKAPAEGTGAMGGLVGPWWVLHTRARNEKVVANELARQQVEYYLPLVRVVRTYAKRKAVFMVPLFPGYLFLNGEYRAYEVALKTNRVANILKVDDQVRLHAELRQIYTVVASGEPVDLYPSLRKGRRCRVTAGTLRGVEGVILRRGRHCRMFLSVTMLGQSAVVEIDAALLEPVE